MRPGAFFPCPGVPFGKSVRPGCALCNASTEGFEKLASVRSIETLSVIRYSHMSWKVNGPLMQRRSQHQLPFAPSTKRLTSTGNEPLAACRGTAQGHSVDGRHIPNIYIVSSRSEKFLVGLAVQGVESSDGRVEGLYRINLVYNGTIDLQKPDRLLRNPMRDILSDARTIGGQTVTTSNAMEPLFFSTNSQAARSASVLLARYLCSPLASLPFSSTSFGETVFQSV